MLIAQKTYVRTIAVIATFMYFTLYTVVTKRSLWEFWKEYEVSWYKYLENSTVRVCRVTII